MGTWGRSSLGVYVPVMHQVLPEAPTVSAAHSLDPDPWVLTWVGG